MKQLIILFCVCCAFNTNAQSRKFKMGIALTPCFSHRVLIESGLSLESTGEQGMMAYQGHFFTQYNISPKLSFQVGLGYALTGYNDKKRPLILATPEPTLPKYIRLGMVYHDITVPLLLRYYRSSLKNKFYFTWGLIPNIQIVRYKNYQSLFDNGSIATIKKKDNILYKPINISGAIGFGYDFTLGKKLHGFVQPIFNYNLFSVYKSDPAQLRMYTVGLSAGVILQ